MSICARYCGDTIECHKNALLIYTDGSDVETNEHQINCARIYTSAEIISIFSQPTTIKSFIGNLVEDNTDYL